MSPLHNLHLVPFCVEIVIHYLNEVLLAYPLHIEFSRCLMEKYKILACVNLLNPTHAINIVYGYFSSPHPPWTVELTG